MLASKYHSLPKWHHLPHFRSSIPQSTIIKRFKFDKREAGLWQKTNIEKALNHFDDFYGTFYGKLWASIRVAMLSLPKHCALVNYYGDYEATIQMMKDMGCIDIQELFQENCSRKLRKRKKLTNKQLTIEEENPEKNEEEAESEAISFEDRVVTPGQASASLLNFVPATKIKGMDDWVEEENQFKYIEPTYDFVVKKELDKKLQFPPLLKAFAFPRGDVTRFPPPKRSVLGTSNYFLMDAASLLPVLALNIQPTESVLDMCAAPGGKTLAILQTIYPNRLVCNDATPSRFNRLKSVVNQYLGKTLSWREHLELRMSNALHWDELDTFDRVLVDVPCTNDRHSVMEDDNNFFKPQRMKERIALPETQSALLIAGVRACKPGGTIVYSTCSLSPIQNDGVVHMAIKRLKEVYKIDTVVKDMSRTMFDFDFLCRFAPPSMLRYGQAVLPTIVNNFGPMYIAKLERANR